MRADLVRRSGLVRLPPNAYRWRVFATPGWLWTGADGLIDAPHQVPPIGEVARRHICGETSVISITFTKGLPSVRGRC